MKRLVIVLLGVGIVGGGFYALLNVDSSVEVVNPRVEQVEVEKEVIVKELEVRIKEAQEEAGDEVNAKLEVYRQELLTEIADEVKLEYIAEIKESISSESY